MENLNFYILTGGPGSGKSTVLKLLSDMGYLTVEYHSKTNKKPRRCRPME